MIKLPAARLYTRVFLDNRSRAQRADAAAPLVVRAHDNRRRAPRSRRLRTRLSTVFMSALASTSAPRAVAPRSFARATCLRVARCRAHHRRSRANAVDRRVSLARAATSDASASPSPADDGEVELAGDIEIPERPTHVRAVDGFLPAADAASLRKVFDDHHDDPKRTHEYRFVWDYWHVPGQYTLLRTPAADYFPEAQYRELESTLLTFAREQLGCAGITPVWLSCYVDGCRQELHADVPHGPWAFVLSLTDWKARKFTGGETLILKPETLDYWRGFDADAVVERESLARLVEPEFNRLVVFDPRLPHGVPVVEGVRDPREGRLVIHGWFNDPEPHFTGGLTAAEAEPVLMDILPPLYETLGELPRARGVVAVRAHVRPDGTVERTEYTADSLVPAPGGEDANPTEIRDAIMLEIAGTLMDATFPAAEEPSVITLPVVFD